MAQIEKDGGSKYANAKLLDSRVQVFLHFAQYAILKFDYTKETKKVNKKIIRQRGPSGTRDGTCDLDRVPANVRPTGAPLPNNIIIRYYDLTKSRKGWRSFYRKNFISVNSVFNDATKEYTTDFAEVVNSGQVPPPPLVLSMSQKRKLFKVLKRKNGNK